ncbi:hypothetical protein H9635_09390 [Solibacillus sp. A46]|uniref:Uncharacterized protein n=1 Tax=Solibacillus faecavium TaxID=2762221 RepID=A0ABR8XYE4_9BACL|nr:hypothetical protein [Solibacillus faecavium]MBD8036957.1 hypothetical protein [Solibacillus faecavium]
MEWQQLHQLSEEYQLQLLEADKLHKKNENVEKLLSHAKREIDRHQLDLQNARQQLNKLENFSFINLFRGWSGKKDQLMEQNLDRVAVIELKLTEAQLTYEDLQDDRVDLIHKLNAINESYVGQQLNQINDQKQQWLQKHAAHIAAELTAIIDQELLCRQLIKEIKEAIEAGKHALTKLTDAGYALNDAKSYSTWDTFLGGGFMATMMKHDKLKESNNYLHGAQIALQRFQNELLDVKEIRQDALLIDTDGFVMFTDYFFDNIFTDWSIHSKITTSMNQISRVQDDVANTISELEQKLDIASRKEAALIKQKEAILNADDLSLFFQK